MLRHLSRHAAALVLAVTAAQSDYAGAAAWTVDPAASEVAFQYQRDGDPATGYFRAFSGKGRFEALSPEDATLEIRIKAASIDLLEPLASAFATSSEWFDAKNHPEIVYQLSSLTMIKPGTFAAAGDLTVRGKTKRIVSEIVLNAGTDGASAEGELTIRRSEFDLGIGLSTAFVEVGPMVTVRFQLAATTVK
ncbi:MAG: YceI family protein [Pseudomonadota bacterium]